jgi:CO dehydrogenase maturation factor
MKIAFAGEGGSGRTTLSSPFVWYLAACGRPPALIDADINQHLGGGGREAGYQARG